MPIINASAIQDKRPRGGSRGDYEGLKPPPFEKLPRRLCIASLRLQQFCHQPSLEYPPQPKSLMRVFETTTNLVTYASACRLTDLRDAIDNSQV